MLEGILLILFTIIGGLTTLLALVCIILAIVRKSNRLLKIGTLVALIPLTLFALSYWYYNIHIPKLNKQQEKAYTGTYIMTTTTNIPDNDMINTPPPRLILNADNTFQLEKNSFISFYGKGTWKAGATDDGQFEFKDHNNSTVFWATPSNNNKLEIDKNFNDRQKVTFIK